MKISWINVVGVLLASSSVYVYLSSSDNFGDRPVAFLLFCVSLVYVIFGFRQRFQSLIIKTSLIIFAIAGVVDFLFFLLVHPSGSIDTPQLINNIRVDVLLSGFVSGLCLLFIGFVIWIFNEIKDIRTKGL